MFGDLAIVLLVTLVLTFIFGAKMGCKGPWASILSFFSVLLLSTWGIGLWIIPFGPALNGTYVLPYLACGVILALILSASTSVRPPRNYHEAVAQTESFFEPQKKSNMIFWILVGILALGIISAYLPADDLKAMP